jgi:hypothetical protein
MLYARTAFLTFLLVALTFGSANAKKRKQKPRKPTCATVRCAPGYQCVENGAQRCVLIQNPVGGPEQGGDLKVRDLDLYGCINNVNVPVLQDGGGVGVAVPDATTPSRKATPMPGGGPSPKPQDAGLTKIQLGGIKCLTKFGYFEKVKPDIGTINDGCKPRENGGVPQCYPVSWNVKTCSWVCGGEVSR